MLKDKKFVVFVLGFYVPPTAKVIRRRDLGLKSHPKDLQKGRVLRDKSSMFRGSLS